MPLQLFSEPFPEAGGANAEAQQRAFGKFDLTVHDVLLRETVQNSWDARLDRSDDGAIDFAMDWRSIDAQQRATLRGEVFATIPSELSQLRRALERDELEVLVVADKGTRGLGGPLRSGEAVASGARTDFRDFVRNLGRDASKEIGGGTFGIGKAVLYTTSAVRTVLIYSQTVEQGEVEPRLIAVTARAGFQRDGKNFTGRHFWGVRPHGSETDIVDPVCGPEAQRLARELGLTSLAEHETGTSIGILQPALEAGETPHATMRHLAHAATTWTWPHLIHESSAGHLAPTIRYRFCIDGSPVEMPDPSTDPAFAPFTLAYRALLEHRRNPQASMQLTTYDSIDSPALRRHLGDLMQVPAVAGGELHESGARIALMRKPRFIVRYLDVSVPVATFRSCGVFVAADDMDEEFARSEPPAHDDWKPAAVQQQNQANPVKVALDRIRSAARAMPGARQAEAEAESADGLPQLSREFGALLTSGAGSGASKRQPAPSRTSRSASRHRQSARVVLTGDIDYIDDGELELAEFGFAVEGTPQPNSFLLGDAWVAIGEGARETRDEAVEQPSVHSWADAAAAPPLVLGSRIELRNLGGSAGVVRVAVPRGAAVGVELTLVDGQEGR